MPIIWPRGTALDYLYIMHYRHRNEIDLLLTLSQIKMQYYDILNDDKIVTLMVHKFWYYTLPFSCLSFKTKNIECLAYYGW